MLQVGIVGYAAAGAFLSLGFFDLYYALVALMTATQVVVRRELAKSSSVKKVAVEAELRSLGLVPEAT
jgi:hypothetical protein